jgi:hypothetical protein
MKRFFYILILIYFHGAGAAEPTTGILGQWTKKCQDIDGDFITATIQIQNPGKWIWLESELAFEDAACSQLYLKFEKQSTAVMVGNNLDLTLQEVAYTPMSKEVADALNEAEFCQIKNWQANKKQSILNKVCADVGNYVSGQKLYSIYKMAEETKLPALFIGAPDEKFDGSTPALRHLRFQAIPFLKVQP